MVGKSEIFAYLQIICTVLAFILNSFLIYIVKNYTKSGIGAYKYVLITFSAFEIVYATVVLIGMPINYIVERSWVVFNHDGVIGKTSLNWLGPTLYCTFYELWMGLVVVHFIYRYIVVCREGLKQKIENFTRYKLIFALAYAVHFVYAVICGFYYCTRSEMSKKIQKHIQEDFGVQEPESIGFILLRLKDLEGNWNPGGIISILNHYVLVLVSVGIIGFCSLKIWISIKKMQKESVHLKEVNLQRQMFATLLIQTIIPFFLCHLPTLVYLIGTSPFVSDSFSFGAASSIFSLLTAVPKVLDPIVIMSCIREYRIAALNTLGLRRGRVAGTVGNSTSDGTATNPYTTRTTEKRSQLKAERFSALEAMRRGEIQIHGIRKAA